MIIFILLLLALPLQAAEHSYVKVLDARAKLVRTYQEKQSQEAIQKAATDMLSELAVSKKNQMRMSDVNFCLMHKPDVHAVDSDGASLIMDAEEHNNMALVRALVKAGADINYGTDTSFGNDTTALELAWQTGHVHNMATLFELGATIGHDLNGTTTDVSMWQEPAATAHRQKMIDAVTQAGVLFPVLSTTIVNYAFGKSPKFDPETGEGSYSFIED